MEQPVEGLESLEGIIEASRLPLTLANITQPPAKFAPQIEAYRRIGTEAGHDPRGLRVAVAGHLHLAKDSQAARERFFPHYSAYFQSHAPKPAFAAPVPRAIFDERASARGPLFVGSPQEVIDKIAYERQLFGHDRFIAQVDLGAQPYAQVAEVIELLGTVVAPAVRGA